MIARFTLIFCTLSLLLSGCGGSSETTNVANGGIGGSGVNDGLGSGTDVVEGGIGGTGISTGPITGFGSIFLNGVKYDIDTAELIREDMPAATQDEFSIGELITIVGSKSADGKTGTAQQVIFSSAVKGEITKASSDNKTMEVLGQPVTTDKLTILVGRKQLTDFNAGEFVEISGYRNSFGQLVATAIKFISPTFVAGNSEQKLRGVVQQISTETGQLQINGLIIDYSNAILQDFGDSLPVESAHIQVTSQQAVAESILAADMLTLITQEAVQADQGDYVEIEGIVTRKVDETHFYLGSQLVVLTPDTQQAQSGPFNLEEGDKVKVKGIISEDYSLVTENVSLRESQATIEIEGMVQTIDYANNSLELLGISVSTDNATILIDDSEDNYRQISLSDLMPGQQVEVKGNFVSANEIIATRIDREGASEDGEEQEIELEGPPKNINQANNTFDLFSLSIEITSTTEFESEAEVNLDSESFFNLITQSPNIQVKVKGELIGVTMIAEEVEIDD